MFAWLKKLDQHFPVRYSFWLLCGIGLMLSLFVWGAFDMAGWLALGFLFLVGLGLRGGGRAGACVPFWGRRGFRRPQPTPPLGAAQLPGDRPRALPARVHPAR